MLQQAPTNELQRLEQGPALERLLPVASIPWHDMPVATPILDTCGQISTTVPCHDFMFRPEPEAVARWCDHIAHA